MTVRDSSAPQPGPLTDFAAAASRGFESDDELAAALSLALGSLEFETWGLYVRVADARLSLALARGPRVLPPTLDAAAPDQGRADPRPDGARDDAVALVVPIQRAGRPLGGLALGPRPRSGSFADAELALLEAVAACLAPALENRLLRDELRDAHRKLSRQAFELGNLLDASRAVAGLAGEEAVLRLLVTTFMAHFLVSRCAVYLDGPRGLQPAESRGLRSDLRARPIPLGDAREALGTDGRARALAELRDGLLKQGLAAARLALVVPLIGADAALEGLVAVGERASALPFSDDERRVAEALGRQGLAALHNARLERVREEKLRQDRELQLAREIQTSLLPSRPLALRGFALAGASRPCFEVGGDAYDWIRLGEDRLALLIADVSGKGTPASLLMASIHAFVHALAGQRPPAELVARLDRFLFERTQASRFATLFYAELETASRRLRYVNAGHVPPFRIAAQGRVSRLAPGGPAVGLLGAEAVYEAGELTLEAGELVAMVTDGVTEAAAADEREFGDERVAEVLLGASGGAPERVRSLVGAVDTWVAPRKLADDLTVLILEAL
jgi:sigma-B regulation protein RsbU (phosphoserine phosphatase)